MELYAVHQYMNQHNLDNLDYGEFASKNQTDRH